MDSYSTTLKLSNFDDVDRANTLMNLIMENLTTRPHNHLTSEETTANNFEFNDGDSNNSNDPGEPGDTEDETTMETLKD